MPTATTMQRVIITIPPALLTQVEDAAAKLNLSRSRLIREALEQYLADQQRLELREQLKEGYVLHAARDLRICEEFTAADYEVSLQSAPPVDMESPI
jgi:CopG family transcriptional regulator/antitoxin EndoAI